MFRAEIFPKTLALEEYPPQKLGSKTSPWPCFTNMSLQFKIASFACPMHIIQSWRRSRQQMGYMMVFFRLFVEDTAWYVHICTIQNLTNISGLVTFGLFCCSILLLLLGWPADGFYLCDKDWGTVESLSECSTSTETSYIHLFEAQGGCKRWYWQFSECVEMNGRKLGEWRWQYLWKARKYVIPWFDFLAMQVLSQRIYGSSQRLVFVSGGVGITVRLLTGVEQVQVKAHKWLQEILVGFGRIVYIWCLVEWIYLEDFGRLLMFYLVLE